MTFVCFTGTFSWSLMLVIYFAGWCWALAVIIVILHLAIWPSPLSLLTLLTLQGTSLHNCFELWLFLVTSVNWINKGLFHDYPKSWTGVSGVATVFAAQGSRKICPLPPLAVDNSLTSEFQTALKIFIFMELQSRISELDQNLSGDFQKNGWNQGQGQGHSREVDHQSPTGLIFLDDVSIREQFAFLVYCYRVKAIFHNLCTGLYWPLCGPTNRPHC